MLAVAGCDNSFTPKTEFEPAPVLYLVLDQSTPMQILRYSSSYDPPGVLPREYTGPKTLDIERVSVTSDAGVSIFTDTLLTDTDGGKYRAFVSRSLKPRAGVRYTLTVRLRDAREYGATAVMPPDAGLTLNGVRTFFYLDMNSPSIHVSAEGAMRSSTPPHGTYFKMWITHWRMNGTGGKDTLREEVPVGTISGENRNRYLYPNIDRGTDIYFAFNSLIEIIRDLDARGDTNYVDLKCSCYCLERNIYSYLKILRGFDDPLSVRTEKPNFTNISGGLGLFGGVTADSLSFPFPRVLLSFL